MFLFNQILQARGIITFYVYKMVSYPIFVFWK